MFSLGVAVLGSARADEPGPSNTAVPPSTTAPVGSTPPGTGSSAPVGTVAPTVTPPPPLVPDAATRALYDEARRLINEGKWVEGCRKMEVLLPTTPTPAVLTNLGECKEHEGKLADASAYFKQAHVMNSATQPEDRRVALEGKLQEGLARVTPRLAMLTVVVDTPVPGLKVRRDTQVLPDAAFGVAIPVDPGAHEVLADAPERAQQRIAFTLKEGESRTVHVNPPVATGFKYPAAATLGGLAVVLGGVTGALGAWTVSAHHDLVPKCAEGVQPCKDQQDMVQSRATTTNVVLGLASAAAVTAGVLFFVERSKAPKVEVAVSPTGGVLRLRW